MPKKLILGFLFVSFLNFSFAQEVVKENSSLGKMAPEAMETDADEVEVVPAGPIVRVEKLDVLVKKSKVPTTNASFTLNGIRQAVTAELLKKELDSEVFWEKIEDKKLNDAAETRLFSPLFLQMNVVVTPPGDPKDQFERAVFSFEFDKDKVQTFFDEIFLGLPDPTIKTFYILPDISIASDMSWSDVGVTKKENFSGVIIDSWKKWAGTQFKNFANIVILDKDVNSSVREKMNSESVMVKWNSNLKKSEVFQDRKSARFELTAQYVLVNAKTNQSLTAFDFPIQKREVGISDSKELSSTLASLVFNLLNSQSAKIKSALELNLASSTLSIVEVGVVGKHGLYDVTLINTFLAERFKDVGLTSELKSYSTDSSVISIKSTLGATDLYATLSKDGGKFPLNEQKILLFSSQNKTFAIIPNSPNN